MIHDCGAQLALLSRFAKDKCFFCLTLLTPLLKLHTCEKYSLQEVSSVQLLLGLSTGCMSGQFHVTNDHFQTNSFTGMAPTFQGA